MMVYANRSEVLDALLELEAAFLSIEKTIIEHIATQ
jgi:hypothetical protein